MNKKLKKSKKVDEIVENARKLYEILEIDGDPYEVQMLISVLAPKSQVMLMLNLKNLAHTFDIIPRKDVLRVVNVIKHAVDTFAKLEVASDDKLKEALESIEDDESHG